MSGNRILRAPARSGGALLGGVLLVVLCTLEAEHVPFMATVITTTAIYAIAATGLDFVVGWVREISVAQATAMAAGGFAGYPLLANHPLWALVVAALAGMVVGAITGLPALRVRGFALATYTLVVSLAATTLLSDLSVFGGTTGEVVVLGTIFGKAIDPVSFTAITTAVLVVAIFIYFLLKHSMAGLSWRAVGENPDMAASLSVNLPFTYLRAFAVSGLFGGVAGLLFAIASNFLAVDSFSFGLSINLLAMVIIGGRGHPLGGTVGAAILAVIDYYIPATTYSPVILGGLLVLVVWLAPSGVAVYVTMAAKALMARVRRSEATGGAAQESSFAQLDPHVVSPAGSENGR